MKKTYTLDIRVCTKMRRAFHFTTYFSYSVSIGELSIDTTLLLHFKNFLTCLRKFYFSRTYEYVKAPRNIHHFKLYFDTYQRKKKGTPE